MAITTLVSEDTIERVKRIHKRLDTDYRDISWCELVASVDGRLRFMDDSSTIQWWLGECLAAFANMQIFVVLYNFDLWGDHGPKDNGLITYRTLLAEGTRKARRRIENKLATCKAGGVPVESPIGELGQLRIVFNAIAKTWDTVLDLFLCTKKNGGELRKEMKSHPLSKEMVLSLYNLKDVAEHESSIVRSSEYEGLSQEKKTPIMLKESEYRTLIDLYTKFEQKYAEEDVQGLLADTLKKLNDRIPYSTEDCKGVVQLTEDSTSLAEKVAIFRKKLVKK